MKGHILSIDLEKNTATVHADDALVTVETDPIIIPKKD